jgi:hypothetical protein
MANNAERQAAYRKRRRDMIDELFSMRGLPSLPAIATIPGWPRWKEAMGRVAYQMQAIEREMSDYYDERTERWQESERAVEFDEKLEMLRILTESAEAWPD